ncbi:MAG: spore cortex biosynthesis protein YabQ [Halanaerobium sp.]|nr:spore cortex biosynthesis protein YabQ [Halanaerobium sp.]
MELKTFLLMAAGGIAYSLLLDIYRAVVRAYRIKGTLLQLLDFLVALSSLLLVFSLIFLGNWGSFRLYVFLGLAGGALLYRLIFDRKVLNRAIYLFRRLRG